MSMARPAAEIEPCRPIFSSSAILPGPIRSPESRSMRRLREGRALDFGMEAMLSGDAPDIATPVVCEQDERTGSHDKYWGRDASCVVFTVQGRPVRARTPRRDGAFDTDARRAGHAGAACAQCGVLRAARDAR